jgi:hypothetical protein
MKPDLISEIISERQAGNSKFSGILAKAMSSRKNPHAVVLGRLGGLKGGPARTLAMSPEARSLQAQKAAKTRWLKLSPTLEASLPAEKLTTKRRRPARPLDRSDLRTGSPTSRASKRSTPSSPSPSPYRCLITWHPDDGCYVGSARPLVGECCRGQDVVDVARQLDAIVKDLLANQLFQ